MIAWAYVSLLMILIAITFLMATPGPNDDHYLYQKFIESLAAGKIDLTIAGFHGTDIFGLVAYIFTRSPLSQIYGLMLPAIALPMLGFLTGRALFRDLFSGIALATILAMMPFISFVCLRGWTGPGYWFWMLLTIFLAARKSNWTGLPWAFAILTKPFAIVLLPVILVLYGVTGGILRNQKPETRNLLRSIITATLLVLAYFTLEYLQLGRLVIGAHEDLSPGGTIQGPIRILMNLAHSLQILFSVHNYYFPTPSLTGPGNLMHTSPVLIFLGLFGIFSPRNYWKDLRLPIALLLGAAGGIAMNALLDHMDHFYMEASIFLLILAALPVLKKHPLWIPITFATLHFQWLYFYLQFRTGFALGHEFFVMPAVIDLCFAVWIGRLCFTRAAPRPSPTAF